MKPDGVDRTVADEDPDVDLPGIAELLRQDLELELVALRGHISRQSEVESRPSTFEKSVYLFNRFTIKLDIGTLVVRKASSNKPY